MNPTNDDFSQEKPRYQPPTLGSNGSANNTPAGWPGVQTPPVGWPNPNQAQAPYPPPTGWEQPKPGTGKGWGPYRQAPPVVSVPLATETSFDPKAEAYKRAVKRVEAKLAFWRHLASYVIVNGALWVMALLTMGGSSSFSARFWPIWITIFWGVGLASQAWNVWGPGEHLREKMIQEEIDKMRHK